MPSISLLRCPWPPACAVLVAALAAGPAPAVVWPLDGDVEVVGALIRDRPRSGETLLDVARLHNIGHMEMRHANPGVDPWLPDPEVDELLVPQLHVLPDAPREGIVVNLAEPRLYYFADAWPDYPGPVVDTHPVGIGLVERATPLGETEVVAKIDDPAWYPTEAVRAFYAAQGETLPAMVPPGPDNPLGQHAIVLEGDGVLIHGTHRPAGVGLRVSQGCIRLYPEAIAHLIRQVPVGTPVRIIHERARLGWRDGALYLEVDAPEDGPDAKARGAEWAALTDRIRQRAAGRPGTEVDWDRVREVFERADSVPAVIGRGPRAGS
ncbi:MAG: L,D-transpeptidase family protein [Wenzhouxiangellaceae bacterium]|nr:L,D-transpeptidase family protein [Wenzhouxiangellaceae bacterium]